MRVLGAIGLCAAGCVPGFGGSPVPDGYSRVEGGIVLPLEMGPYDLYHLEESPVVLIGTVARYGIPADEPQQVPPFDLFVYPMAGRDLDDEIAEAREELRRWDEVNQTVEGTTLGPTIASNPIHSEHPLYLTPIHSVQNGVAVRSFMYITRVAERFLKVRVSYSAATPESIDRAMHRRVELLVDDISRHTVGEQ